MPSSEDEGGANALREPSGSDTLPSAFATPLPSANAGGFSIRRACLTSLASTREVTASIRACELVSAPALECPYESVRDDDAELVERIHALACERPRYGYRRTHAHAEQTKRGFRKLRRVRSEISCRFVL